MLANGCIANTWRIQIIQTAKAYAAQPEVAADLAEFKVVSPGGDVAAQISAINNFIASGHDANNVNLDQNGIGTLSTDRPIDHIPNGGKVPAVRGASLDTDRRNGAQEALAGATAPKRRWPHPATSGTSSRSSANGMTAWRRTPCTAMASATARRRSPWRSRPRSTR